MKAIADAAASTAKKMVSVEGADHNFNPSGKKAGKKDQYEQFANVIRDWIGETFK